MSLRKARITILALPRSQYRQTVVSPHRLTTVIGSLFISLLFWSRTALVLEYFDDTIRTTEEIESYLGLPALAAIPSVDSLPKRRLLLVGSGEEASLNPELADERRNAVLPRRSVSAAAHTGAPFDRRSCAKVAPRYFESSVGRQDHYSS
jgi:hypothetical protein